MGLAAPRVQASNRGQSSGKGAKTPPAPPSASAPIFTAGPTVGSITQTGAQISWTSDQFVQAWVEYGTTGSYGSETAHETSFNYQSHVQTLSGLTNNTLYHYKVHIVNQDTLASTTGDLTFTTLAQDPVEPPPDPVSPDYGPRSAPTTPVGSYVKTLPGTGGIDLTGSVECSAAVQSWYDANVPSGTAAQHTVFVIPSGSSLKLNAAIKTTSTKHHVTTWMYGANLNKVSGSNLDSNDGSSMFWVVGTNNLKFLGGHLNGGFTSGGTANSASAWGAHEHAHGITAWNNTSDIEIADMVIDKVYGDGVYSSGWSGSQHNRWNVHHNTFSNCGRMNLTKNGGGDDWIVENNIFRNPALSNVDLEDFGGPPQTINRLTIRNNWFDGWMCYNQGNFGYTPAFGLFIQSSEITQPMDQFVFDNNLFSRGWLGYGGPSGGACPGGQAIIDCANRWAGASPQCGGTPSKTNWFFRGNKFDANLPSGNGGLCTGSSTNNRLGLAVANCNIITITNNDLRGMVISTAAYTSNANSSGCGSFNNPACTNVTSSGNT